MKFLSTFAPHLAGRMLPGLFSYMPFGKSERFPGDPWPHADFMAATYWMHTSQCSADPLGCLHGLFHASCAGCNARALARSPDFFESQRTLTLTAAYRAALRALGVSHDDVKAAADRSRT